MVGATAARPPKKGTYIGVVVRSLRTSLRLAYVLLTVSGVCVMSAFASAGFVMLPSIQKKFDHYAGYSCLLNCKNPHVFCICHSVMHCKTASTFKSLI
jgi:hypothetical protein